LNSNGFLKSFNPVLKFIGLIMGIFITVIKTNVWSQIYLLVFILIFTLFILIFDKINKKLFFVFILKISLFLIIISIVLPLFNEFDEKIIYLRKPVVIGQKKILFVLNIFLRSFLSLLQIAIFKFTTSFGDITVSLNFFKVPSAIRDMIMLIFKYFNIIEKEIRQMRKAMILRGFKNRSLKEVKYIGGMFANLFILSVNKGENLLKSLELRGNNFDNNMIILEFKSLNVLGFITYPILMLLIKFVI